MQNAAVLKAADRHSDADRDLQEATRIQGVIDRGITALGEKAVAVLSDVNAAIELLNSAVPSANQTGVRSNTRNLIQSLGGELTSCADAVAGRPYEVEEQLAGINRRIQEAMGMIETDLELLGTINSVMTNAALYESSATAAIARAEGATFGNFVVDLDDAKTALSSYNSASAEVTSLVAAENYEAALDVANGASFRIQSVSGLVSDAISLAEQQNQDEIDRLAKIEADRLQAIKDAEEGRRQEEISAKVEFAASDDSDSGIDFSGTED
jgi:hypothetical protein